MDRFVGLRRDQARDGRRAPLDRRREGGAVRRRPVTVAGRDRPLLDAAVAAGTVRGDVDAEDVFRAMGGIWSLPLEKGWQERARRMLGLLMDGLRYGA